MKLEHKSVGRQSRWRTVPLKIVRRNSCFSKDRFANEGQAARVLTHRRTVLRDRQRKGDDRVYRCPFCKAWHYGRANTGNNLYELFWKDEDGEWMLWEFPQSLLRSRIAIRALLAAGFTEDRIWVRRSQNGSEN